MNRNTLVCQPHNEICVDDSNNQAELGIEARTSAHANGAQHSFGGVPILAPQLKCLTDLDDRRQEATLQHTICSALKK